MRVEYCDCKFTPPKPVAAGTLMTVSNFENCPSDTAVDKGEDGLSMTLTLIDE